MFRQAFPERDLLRRNLLVLDGDRRFGGLSRKKSGKGEMVWETVPDGLAATYKEDATIVGVEQTENRVSVSVGKMMTATYDRNSSALVSLDASLIALAIVAATMKVDMAHALATPILETLQENQDIRMFIDFMGGKPTIYFYSTNAKDEVVELLSAEAFTDIGEGHPPNMIHQQWVGETPLFRLPMEIVVEIGGVSAVVRGIGKSYWMPVVGFFKDTITTDLSGEELKALVHNTFPAIDFIDQDQL